MHWLDLFDRGQHEHKPLEEGEEEEDEDDSSSSTSDGDTATPSDLTVPPTSLTADSGAEAKVEEDEETRKRLEAGTSGLEHAGDVEMSGVAPVAAEGAVDEESGAFTAEGGEAPLVEGEGRPPRHGRHAKHVSRRRAVSTEDAQLLASESVPSVVKFDRQYLRPRLMRRGVAELNNPDLDMSPKEGRLHHHHHHYHRRQRRRQSREGLPRRRSDAEVVDLDLSGARARAASDSIASPDSGALGAPTVEVNAGADVDADAGADAGGADDPDVQRKGSAPAGM